MLVRSLQSSRVLQTAMQTWTRGCSVHGGGESAFHHAGSSHPAALGRRRRFAAPFSDAAAAACGTANANASSSTSRSELVTRTLLSSAGALYAAGVPPAGIVAAFSTGGAGDGTTMQEPTCTRCRVEALSGEVADQLSDLLLGFGAPARRCRFVGACWSGLVGWSGCLSRRYVCAI